MNFFKKFFKEYHEMDTGEWAVKCPFPHTDEKGDRYYESVPSAHINQRESVFHCKVCGKGLSEASFVAQLQGVSYKDALILLKEMDKHEGSVWVNERAAFLNSESTQEHWLSLGLSSNVADELKIGYSGEGFDFPVFIYGEILDVRNYSPGRKPKVLSEKGAKNLLLPFDLWVNDERPTLLCAGEKDMAIGRQMGFNSLSFTGGEQAFPKLFKASFRGKRIFIVYDNDQAGIEGSRKIASLLKDAGAFPHVVTKHYETCKEKGEDLHDYFHKYGRTGEDLQKILDETPEFSEEDYRKEQEKYIPLVSITKAMEGQYANRVVSSRVAVVATYEESFHVPEFVEFHKGQAGEKCTMATGEIREWVLDKSNIKDILLLMDSNLKQQQINDSLKMLAGIPHKEANVRVVPKSRAKIHKAVVTDDLESDIVKDESEKVSMRELLIYSVNEEIERGAKYRMQFKPTAHPLKGSQVVGIATKLEESDNSMNRFVVSPKVLDSLEVFKVREGQTVKNKMHELYERAKGLIGVEARKDVTFATDLFFHTPLEFIFGNRKERAYLDVMMIGDPRTGKSQAAKKLLQTYELGLITSLKTATTAGLLGGSDQTNGGWKTKLGLLPRNNKGAIIMEEFSGGGQDLVSKLTEVRSSNRVRLTRVNGSIDVPAMVRMMSISNPATGQGGNSLPLRSYPHGIKVLLDLIGASEDIARYDFFLLVDEPDRYISPLEEFEHEPFAKESYINRIRWVWSRKPNQIQMEKHVQEHIVDLAQGLNNEYNSHIKLFGPEAWKKLARMSIACAGMLCSMDESGDNLVVKTEHVEWSRNFLKACYDNKLFKLKEYVESERRLTHCDKDALIALQGLYSNHAVMLQQLEMSTEMSQRQLQTVSGLDQKDFAKVINNFVAYGFVQYQGERLVPTGKFRDGMTQIDRQVYMKRLGE